jgi:hypothetical protein
MCFSMKKKSEQLHPQPVRKVIKPVTDIKKELLATRYQQAFLDEKATRENMNVAIAKLRAAEKNLKMCAIELADYSQLKLSIL